MLPRLTSSLRRLFFAGLIAGALVSDAGAAEAPADNPSLRSRMREDLLRMNDFFDTMLPGTLSEYNVILKFSPKFSDLRDREFVRYPLELRYGLAPRWEVFGGMTPFHPNPFNTGRDHRWGFGELRFGVRHDFGKFLFYDQSTFGFEQRSPLGAPPDPVIGHYTHLRPFLVASRKLPIPHTTFFTNFSYDREVNTPTRAGPPGGLSKMHIVDVAPGLLYKPGEFGAFGEYRIRHIALNVGNHLAHDSKVGVIWDVPLARSQRRKLPGKWQVELAYKYNHEEGLETDQGVTARVSWRTSLREILKAPEKPVTAK